MILGAAAGGGLPQWNCGCVNCSAARAGVIPASTQSSVAVSANGQDWVILNASPDIRQQMHANPALHPKEMRGTPVKAVLLTNGDVDHVAGLLVLREKTAFEIFATPDITRTLAQNPIFGVLDPDFVRWNPMDLGQKFRVAGLEVEVFSVPGKVPLYLEGDEVITDAETETTIGLMVSDGRASLAYVPGCARVTTALKERFASADLTLFDGTVWQNAEMPKMGAGMKTGLRMGHLPISGPDGSLAQLEGLSGRRAYIHINNTNPILQPDSPERQSVIEAGWEICADGMEFIV